MSNKLRIHLKTPDASFAALKDLPEDKHEHAEEVMRKYVEYGECVTIEFDLDNGTATVVPVV